MSHDGYVLHGIHGLEPPLAAQSNGLFDGSNHLFLCAFIEGKPQDSNYALIREMDEYLSRQKISY